MCSTIRIGWTEEIARFLLIAVTFIGVVMVVRKESQIAVEFFYRWLPRPRAPRHAFDLRRRRLAGVLRRT